VEAVGGVVLHVPQVHERGFGQVVVGEIQLADLGRHHRLDARRQRGVAHGERLVVGEVGRLLLGGERLGAQVHGQVQVRLLDDLLAVQLEVRVVQQQRIVLLGGVLEIIRFITR
jgi:hypothetical protein